MSEKSRLKSFDQLYHMYKTCVWSNEGYQYMPMYGYNNEVVAYAPALKALDAWRERWMM